MIIDKALQLSDKQAITVSAASTNYIDQGAAGDAYDPIYLHGIVGAALTGGTSVQISIQTATDAAFTTPITLFQTAAIAAADLTAGKEVLKTQLPWGTKRYIRAYYTVVGTFSAGTISINGTKDVKI